MFLKQPDTPNFRSPPKSPALRAHSLLVERGRLVVSMDREARLGLHEFTAAGKTYECAAAGVAVRRYSWR
jgi:hypothetical protein